VTAIVQRAPGARDLSPGRLSDPITLGEVLARSGYFQDARDAAKAAVKVMAGAELGFGPIASMRGVDIIKGEVSLSAGLTAALVRGSGVYDYAIKRWDNQGCTLVFTRNGKALDPEITFDEADARKANLLGGDNYRRFPRSMYFARAMTMGARAHCPDLFGGAVYTPDELEAQREEAVVEQVKQAFDATEETEAATETEARPNPMPSTPPPDFAIPETREADEPVQTVNGSAIVSAEEAAAMREYLERIGAPESFWRMGLMMLSLDDLGQLTKSQAHQLMADAKSRFGGE
jgi:hypothetical protein